MSLLQVSDCLSDRYEVSLDFVLPHLAPVAVEAAGVTGGRVQIWARVRADGASCPHCGQFTQRVHSGYERRLADAPAGGQPVTIRLAVRRFFCGNPGCGAVTFAEQVQGLTTPRARRTPLLARMLTAAGLALSGRAGARLSGALGLPAGRSSMLRLVMALPDPQTGTVKVLGVDDFAFRRGRDYGTILVNAETGEPVDLLRDREAHTLARWLREHPGTEVICRDRAGAYAAGARDGAPDAIQVADRWHLYHNLAGYVEKTVARHRHCLQQTSPEPQAPGPAASQDAPGPQQPQGESALAARTRQRYEQVQALRAQRLGITAIAARTGLARQTVRRFARAASADELLAGPGRGLPSLLDDYQPYLRQRWNEGCTSARQLHADLRQRGYTGSYGAVANYVLPFRRASAPPPAPPRTRDLARWILTDPASLDDDEQAEPRRSVRERCPHLDALAAHVTEFAKILTGRRGEQQLDSWIAAASADNQPDLRSFITGLNRDYRAVLNGLTLPYSSGKVEGNVNRIKMLKRQMYGRARFDLLRKRVLLA